METRTLASFVDDLRAVVAASRTPDTLDGVAERLAGVLYRAGLPVDRIQLPLSALFGMKHPRYFGIVLTWVRGGGGHAWLRPLQEGQEHAARRVLRQSPFAPLVFDEQTIVRHRAGAPGWDEHEQLSSLREAGFVDYIATVAELPDGARQVISIATRAEGGFAPDATDLLRALSSPLALALYAIYQAQLAHQIATTYLGDRTGALVLDGRMGRGRSASLRAGVSFLDIRGFTALSRELSTGVVVSLLNAAFEAIDAAVRPVGGEILKLIGDAALVIFPIEAPRSETLLPILRALLDASESAAAATAELGQPLRLGVGFHIGDVLYGNVGARDRHDFTVMGPAVNLASRLEGLTKELGASMVVSEEAASHCWSTPVELRRAEQAVDGHLRSVEQVTVRGVPEPVRVWTAHRHRIAALSGPCFPVHDPK